jgi:hypothetical protein
MRQYAARTRYERGRLALARGDRETGLRRLREARAAAADLNSGLLVEKCERRIAAVENDESPGRATGDESTNQPVNGDDGTPTTDGDGQPQ